MSRDCRLSPDRLKRIIKLEYIEFDTTSDVPPLESVIGQDRAVRAIKFGLQIDDPSYNIFVTGMRGTGRTTIVKDLLNKMAARKPTPGDWVFVYNFEQPDEPLALELPKGRARKLERDFSRLMSGLKNALVKTFEGEDYAKKKNEVVEAFQVKKRKIFGDLEEKASALNIQIKSTNSGFQTIPIVDEKPLDEEQYQKMTKAQKAGIDKSLQSIQQHLKNAMREIALLDRDIEEEIDALDMETARFILESKFSPLFERYSDCKMVQNYFNQVIEDIVQNVYAFMGINQEQQNGGGNNQPPKQADKYRINVAVDNSNLKGAPVIHELNPTYNNLFGRIEKKSYMGYLYTDYTLIKAGSILKANGGYLILDIDQIVRQPFVYDALKRTLRSRCLHIEDVHEFSGYMTSAGLKPAPIPIDVIVIIIGHRQAYHALHAYDDEFRKIIKVRADFDYEVPDSKRNIYKYVQFIARVVREEKLLPFGREAVRAIIEQAMRLVDHQGRLSLHFSEIVRLIREASYWAKSSRRKVVTPADVKKAVLEEKFRRNLSEEKILNSIREKSLIFDVNSFKAGQINGLAVYSLGDYSFGKPNRITVSTYIGSKGIINIEREAKLSGRIHDKGMLILNGYFAGLFGRHIPLSFSASITFEQSYGRIDGDSASCAELYALLSSLAQAPIYQGIAVTGSVNQKGEVQAIGGVNEKIEGFYDVCKMQRLNGKQGVIIPTANVKNLMLNDEVVEAVAKGKFNIWAVNKIEEGIEILTGIPAGQMHKDGTFTKDSIFDRVQKRIKEYSTNARRFGKQVDLASKKEIGDSEENEGD